MLQHLSAWCLAPRTQPCSSSVTAVLTISWSRTGGTEELLQNICQQGDLPAQRLFQGALLEGRSLHWRTTDCSSTAYQRNPDQHRCWSDKDLQSQSSMKGSLTLFPTQVTDSRIVLRRWLETHHLSHPLHLEKRHPFRMSFSFHYLRKNNLTWFIRTDLHKCYHPDFNISQYC